MISIVEWYFFVVCTEAVYVLYFSVNASLTGTYRMACYEHHVEQLEHKKRPSRTRHRDYSAFESECMKINYYGFISVWYCILYIYSLWQYHVHL